MVSIIHVQLFLVLLCSTLLGFVQGAPLKERGVSGLSGITFNAYNSDGSCMSTTDIHAAIRKMKNLGISNIRTYSQECNQLSNILNAIDQLGGGIDVLAAVWIDGSSNDGKEIEKLKSVLHQNKGLSAINGILVGNEVLFKGTLSPSALENKIKQVKAVSGGIKVGTSDVATAFSRNIISASDFLGVSIYPFFTGVSINNAVSSLNTQYQNFKKLAGSKQVFITETGWPSAGSSNQNAQASMENAKKYVNGLSKSGLPYYYFEWQDSKWKGDGVEQHFGFMSSSDQSKF
ncbi:glycoside hydrolase family 17 protein [Backusella circina FSU 941]|nr:glycoside hydrolase family 17 protein [Backusella circina FSU 941]